MTYFIATTVGALLLGAFCAAVLSGVVLVQTFLYVKLFPRDSPTIKTIVGAVWILDIAHSLLVYTSVWIYLITEYGKESQVYNIPVPLALTVITTAVLTFIVHCFFAHRIHRLSRQQWQFTALVVVLAFFRLCCASVTTVEMIRQKTFPQFKMKFRWVFTLGLATSSLVDIFITVFLTYSLHSLQSESRLSNSLDRVIGAVVLYTLETNLLTSAATVVSMICWLVMSHNLIFMGLHFFIAKLYANSLLATLNSRKHIEHQRQRSASADLPSRPPRFLPRSVVGLFSRNDHTTTTRITVQKTVDFAADDKRSSSDEPELA